MDKSVSNKTNKTIGQPKNELTDEGTNEWMDGSGVKVAVRCGWKKGKKYEQIGGSKIINLKKFSLVGQQPTFFGWVFKFLSWENNKKAHFDWYFLH